MDVDQRYYSMIQNHSMPYVRYDSPLLWGLSAESAFALCAARCAYNRDFG